MTNDSETSLRLDVGSDRDGERLDVFLSRHPSIPSRAQARRLIDDGRVLLNGQKPFKAGHRLQAGDRIEVAIPAPEPTTIVPEEIPLDILYEDEHLLIVNKPKGLVVHPAPGHRTGTLVHALVHHLPSLPGIGGVERPGIVHRLDKETTGVLVVAKSEEAHQRLSRALKARAIKRVYLTLVHGVVDPDAGTIDAPIGRHPVRRKSMAVVEERGRKAVTHFQVIERFERYTFLELRLETGRTHQIRVHLAHIGHPVVGDTTYGPKKPHFFDDGQALHAAEISLSHPISGESLTVRAPLPDRFSKVLAKLRLDA